MHKGNREKENGPKEFDYNGSMIDCKNFLVFFVIILINVQSYKCIISGHPDEITIRIQSSQHQ